MGLMNSAVSVIIPTLNEEEGIGPTLEEIKKVLDYSHVVVVDGKSVDRTVEIAKNMGVDVLLQEGRGKGDAINQALSQLPSTARYIAFTDADFTYPAEYLPKMIEILEQDNSVGMVLGNRFGGKFSAFKSSGNPFYIGNRMLAFAQYTINGVKLYDPLSGLRVVRAEILQGWKPKSKGFDVEAELNSLINRKGYKIVEIPIYYRSRLGEKKLKLRHGFGIMKRILAEGFTSLDKYLDLEF
ncbi:MAG: glycosyltransferase family 2 protein [Candidatus Bathyarchaeota archaeon]|nr:glycosyltransferase family 2 protein [Candidatus Bathyarchaeota archaeon]